MSWECIRVYQSVSWVLARTRVWLRVSWVSVSVWCLREKQDAGSDAREAESTRISLKNIYVPDKACGKVYGKVRCYAVQISYEIERAILVVLIHLCFSLEFHVCVNGKDVMPRRQQSSMSKHLQMYKWSQDTNKSLWSVGKEWQMFTYCHYTLKENSVGVIWVILFI